MVARKGLLAPQNTFLDTIAARFDGTRKIPSFWRYSELLIALPKPSPDSAHIFCIFILDQKRLSTRKNIK